MKATSVGVGYYRFRVVDKTAALRDRIHEQAVSFQTIFGWHSNAAFDVDETRRTLLESLHYPVYRQASNSIKAMVDFPVFDNVRQCATDVPELEYSWRVSALAGNPIFPPLWRLKAFRTILPDEVSQQVEEWRRWTSEVAGGMHEHYLRWLHLHHTTDFLRYHWSCLRANAVASISKLAKWANSPEINDVREQIIRLPEPTVIAAPILAAACTNDVTDEQYVTALEQVKTVNELTRAWNYHAKSSHRLPDYRSNYCMTLAEFTGHASDECLAGFLVWAQRSAEEQCGLFLDY